MKHVRSIGALAVAMSLGLAACGGGGSVAATVNGVDITTADVEGIMVEGEVGDAQFLEALTTLIQWEVSEQAAEADFGVVPSDEDVDAEMDLLLAQFGATTMEEFAEGQGISEDLVNRYIRQVVVQNGVADAIEADIDPPTADAVSAERAANPRSWTEVCASHFLVETEDEAVAALDRVVAGEPFADVATEVSLDTGSGASGGDLGCNTSDAYVDAFAQATLDAPLGEPFGPVETEYGFHVLLVSSRTELADEEIADTLVQSEVLDASEQWFDDAVRTAEVTVNEEFGVWSTDPEPQILTVQ